MYRSLEAGAHVKRSLNHPPREAATAGLKEREITPKKRFETVQPKKPVPPPRT